MPSYPPPPQVGFNNNVRHRGRVFHIQTEDSGVKRPHITTHLFVDGGRIVSTQRFDYAHLLDQPALHELVRQQMKVQHKKMFLALRDGALDPLLDEMLGPASSGPGLIGSVSVPQALNLSERDLVSSMPQPPGLGAAADGLHDHDSGPFSRSRSSAPPAPRPEVPAYTGRGLPRPGASPAERPEVPVYSARGPSRSSPPPPRRTSYPPPLLDPGGRSQEPFPSAMPRSRPSLVDQLGDGHGRPSARASLGGALFRGKPQGEQSLDDVILSYITEDLDSSR